MEDDFLTGPLACCSVLRVNAPVLPRRPSTLTLVLIRRWTHLIPPLTPHSPFVPATSCPDPNIDPQVDQAYFAPHPPPVSPHGFNYDISKTSLLYRLSLICFWHLRTLSKNRTNERTNELPPAPPVTLLKGRDPFLVTVINWDCTNVRSINCYGRRQAMMSYLLLLCRS